MPLTQAKKTFPQQIQGSILVGNYLTLENMLIINLKKYSALFSYYYKGL